MKISVVLIYFLGWVTIVGCDSEYPSQQEEKRVLSSNPTTSIFATNAISQAPAFIGQVVFISGKITHIKNSGGQPALQLDDVVICAFGSRFRKPISNLRVGETVRFKGLVDSVNRAGVYLTPCVILVPSKE